jgi:hypothetical protein
MTFVWDVFTLLLTFFTFWFSKEARTTFQQRRAFYAINPHMEIDGMPSMLACFIRLWGWRVLFIISLVILFYNYRARL